MGHRRQFQSPPKRELAEREFPERRHHNFTIELFLDEAGRVGDIFIDDHDIQEKPEKISGWKPERIIDFITLHAGLHTMNTEPETVVTSQISKSAHTRRQPSTPKAPTEITGIPHLRDLRVLAPDSENPAYLLPKGRPFTVRFTLDLAELIVPRNIPLIYEATIIARQPGCPSQHVGKLREKIRYSKNRVVNVTCPSLPEGLYHVSALVKLTAGEAEHVRNASMIASIEGSDIVEVY